MKKILILALALVMGVLAVTAIGGQPARAETEDEVKSETVLRAGAVGRVTVEPDIAYLTAGASVERDKAADAMADVSAILDDVLAAIKDAGIADDDIKTQSVGVEAVYDYSRSTPRMTGYLARNSLAITIRDLDSVGALLDAVIEAGANDVGSLVFDKENKNEAYDEALRLAVARAAEKAEVLLAAAGLEGELVLKSMEEVTYGTYAADTVQAPMPEMKGAGIMVIPGTIEISAGVTAEYSVQR